ncbi:cation efflux system protein [Cellvibrio zantedeschiae]|uniref:Cation efflux system protein n=1 Tax=Cellvibrio zantedeschiae TaxID=1237077 RepID=A0ABQ3AT50_9GAMM|nr:efflux RND transporter periplasmic adaptor subunit [Cellvibrio zantedeschiae]GGY63723.1 cation efflux system protein [Cellvibrio zantedeschiae]
MKLLFEKIFTSKYRISSKIFALIIFASISACSEKHNDHAGHGSEGHGSAEHESGGQTDIVKGPHKGRLLSDGDFSVELAIFERGVPPEYRAWATDDGDAIAPKDWQLSVELSRLSATPTAAKSNKLTFLPQDDFLRGQGEVQEPHSFDVSVTATYKNKKHQWKFSSYEGRVQLSAALAKESGVTTAIATAGNLKQTIKLYGQALPDPVRVSHIQARYPGVIRAVKATIGDKVKVGDVLASVESNESLRQYNITAPISGTIIERHANPDEFTGEKILFTLVDYSQLEAHLHAFPAQTNKLKAGQSVLLEGEGRSALSNIESLTSHEDGASTLIAHIPLPNHENDWVPNQSLEGTITLAEIPVALRIDNRALQNFRDWQVVFVQVGDTYEIRPLELGQTDGEFTEVINGLNPGDHYVVDNSYLLKADLEKSGASHDH